MTEVSNKVQEKLKELNITTAEELIAMAAVEGCKEKLAKYLGLGASAFAGHLEKVKKTLPGRVVAAMEEPYREEFGLGAIEPSKKMRLMAGSGPYEAAAISPAALPSNVNYISRMPIIKSQGQRGTCVGFACTALNEDYSTLYKGTTPDLSEQCLYQRCKENDGQPNSAGTWVNVAMDCLVNSGEATESCQPYNPNLPHNQPGPHPSCCNTESPQWKIYQKQQLNQNSVADIKAAIADNKVVAFSIPVYHSWYDSAAVRRTGNITMPLPGEQHFAGHAMLFVGYQDDAATPGGGYFILRNSWGTTWGYQCTYGAGYGTLPYQYIADNGWEAFTYTRPVMVFIEAVARYDAFLYPNEGKQSGRINLYCKDSKLYLIFRHPSDTLPPNTYDAASKIGVAYQSFSQFQHYLDLVRNEKPIWVTFRPEDRPPTFVVYCASELPGEGEI